MLCVENGANGMSAIAKWLLGILAAILLGTGGAVISQGQRIASLETDAKNVRDALGRIESKLDRALERLSKRE